MLLITTKDGLYSVTEENADHFEVYVKHCAYGVEVKTIARDEVTGMQRSKAVPTFKKGDYVVRRDAKANSLLTKLSGECWWNGYDIWYQSEWGTRTGLAGGFNENSIRLATEEELAAGKSFADSYSKYLQS